MSLIITIFFLLFATSCQSQTASPAAEAQPSEEKALPILSGATRIDEYVPLLEDKQVALLVNQTAVVGDVHLVDTLVSLGVKIKRIFAPEHGFRGAADAGEHVKDSVDARTGVRIISLYGNKKKPSKEDLAGIDVFIFDIQDVGVRYYTFISSLRYLMEACAENNIPLIILDRPNPNGMYVDGPVLKKEFQSFVGVDAIPVVHGLTVAEYAYMVNDEHWLRDSLQCDFQVVLCTNYDHSRTYELPIKPSPNLPNTLAIALYPSLGFFEGANVSVGRGTDYPFQIIGSPNTKFAGAYTFTPQPKPGAKTPPFLNKECYGYNLKLADNQFNRPESSEFGRFTFEYVITMYNHYTDKADFFLKNNFFDKLCGTDAIRKMIIAGKTEAEIRASYQAELAAYKAMRKKHLIYKDFE
jgi:uncharacterized protein YbbC (DUF1343 family)